MTQKHKLLAACKAALDRLTDPYLGEDDGARAQPEIELLEQVIAEAEGSEIERDGSPMYVVLNMSNGPGMAFDPAKRWVIGESHSYGDLQEAKQVVADHEAEFEHNSFCIFRLVPVKAV